MTAEASRQDRQGFLVLFPDDHRRAPPESARCRSTSGATCTVRTASCRRPRRGSSMPYDQITGVLIPRLAACRVEPGDADRRRADHPPAVHWHRGAGIPRWLGWSRSLHQRHHVDRQPDRRAGDGRRRPRATCHIDGFRPSRTAGSAATATASPSRWRLSGNWPGPGSCRGCCARRTPSPRTSEYRELCEFATENGADYVLMNPLSSMGRGVKVTWPASRHRRAHAPHLRADRPVQRPPGHRPYPVPRHRRPAARGLRGGHHHLRVHPGEVTVCPYLVFAARTPQSRHDPCEFIVGNIFADADIAARLDNFNFARRYPMGANPTCGSCGMSDSCGKGCPAAVISAGERIGAVDAEVCPVTSEDAWRSAADARVSARADLRQHRRPGRRRQVHHRTARR